MAENKYKAHLPDEDNEWGKLSDEQEQIITMNVKINAFKNHYNKDSTPKKSNNNQGKQDKSSSMPGKSTGETNNDKKAKGKDKSKWRWKNVPPKATNTNENGLLVCTYDKKKYYWCPNHNNDHPNYCEAHP